MPKYRKQIRVDATSGPLLKCIGRLMAPIMTANLTMVIHQVVNTFWLGRAGADAVAAMAVALPIMIFMWAIGDGIILGGSAVAARQIGAGNEDRVGRVSGQVFLLVFSYYAALAVVVMPFLPRIVAIIGTPSELVDDVLSFVRIMMVVLPLSEMFFTYNNLLQGIGNSMSSMKIWTATMATNIILDPILILGWGFGAFEGLGVTGAAAASVLSRIGCSIYVIDSVIRGRHGITIGVDDIRPHWKLIKRILRISMPIGGERVLTGAEQITLVSIVATFGSPVLAAYGVGQRILHLAIMPGFAASAAATSAVGQNIGAGLIGRGERAAWMTSALIFAVLSLFGFTMALFPELLITIFNSEPEVVSSGVDLLRTVGPSVGFLGIFLVLGGVYRALEKTVPYFGWVLISCWVIRIPLAYFLSQSFGSQGIWWGMASANVLAFIGAAIHLKYTYLPGLHEKTVGQFTIED